MSAVFHIFQVGDPWFEYIRDRRKMYEGRRWWQKTKIVQPNDFICFQRVNHKDQTCIKRVKKIHLFPSFEVALRALDLEQVLPEVKTVEDGVEIYQKFVSLATQEKEGICMIELY